MKKLLFLCGMACCLVACTSDESFLGAENLQLPNSKNELRNNMGIERGVSKITGNDAVKVASLFAKAGHAKTRSLSGKEFISVTPVSNDEGLPLMYVAQYAENGGWAIISASKKTDPILAYADEGTFDFENEVFNEWLDSQKDVISKALTDSRDVRSPYWLEYEKDDLGIIADTRAEYVNIFTWRHNTIGDIEDGIYASYENNSCPSGYMQEDYYFSSGSQANSYFGGGITSIVQVVQERLTNRGYSEDYALYHLRIYRNYNHVEPLIQTSWHQEAPYNDSIPNNWLVGCNAIAMGQVMNYHQYPDSFNWSQINTYNSTAQKSFLKQLYNNLQTYQLNGASVALFGNVKSALEAYGYSVSLTNSYDANMMKIELAEGRPLIISGRVYPLNNEGHSYICDGYRDNSYKTYYLTVYIPNTDRPSNGLLNYNPYTPQTDLRTTEMFNTTYQKWHINWGTLTNSLVWLNYDNILYCEEYDKSYEVHGFLSIDKDN